jgi:hypothetical protein
MVGLQTPRDLCGLTRLPYGRGDGRQAASTRALLEARRGDLPSQ